MRVVSLAFAACAFFSLCGCAATVTPTYTPSGRQGFSVDCSSDLMTWGDCYKMAGDICGAKGYDIIDKIGDQAASVPSGQHGVYGGTVTRTMVISCK